MSTRNLRPILNLSAQRRQPIVQGIELASNAAIYDLVTHLNDDAPQDGWVHAKVQVNVAAEAVVNSLSERLLFLRSE